MSARAELMRLLTSVTDTDRARTLVDLHHAEVLSAGRQGIKAEVLRQAAVDLIAACPDHGDSDETWLNCPCEYADDLSRQADLAAAVDVMGALPMPTGEDDDSHGAKVAEYLSTPYKVRRLTPLPGELAEQRHLIDPRDHDFEQLANGRPAVQA